ncbi:MAG TPA: DUF4157 domain-containing protein, partial [Kofleriaceae bacterium]
MGGVREHRLVAEAHRRRIDDEPVRPRDHVPGRWTEVERLLARLEGRTPWPGDAAESSDPGRRTRVLDVASPKLGFDDYRVLGLRELLRWLGPEHPLRREVVAAARTSDRAIARRATQWREPAGGAATPDGHALWHVAERHAVTLYRRASGTGAVIADDPAVAAALAQRGSGEPLPPELRRDMERELGVSLVGVRIHRDSLAVRAATTLHAEAFTVGEDVFFADGRFAPETRTGRKLLVHELTHVAQALRGGAAAAPGGLRVSEPGEPREREADAVAERADRAAMERAGAGPREREADAVAKPGAAPGFAPMDRAARIQEVAKWYRDGELGAALARGEPGVADAVAAALHDGAILAPHPVDELRDRVRGLGADLTVAGHSLGRAAARFVGTTRLAPVGQRAFAAADAWTGGAARAWSDRARGWADGVARRAMASRDA